MDKKKYSDMAYLNPLGIKWYTIIKKNWSQWLQIVKKSNYYPKVNMRGGTLEDYAQRIIIEAVWYMGTDQDMNDLVVLARCARRLRLDEKGGKGEDTRGTAWKVPDSATWKLPYEFYILDVWLESLKES